MGKFSRRILQPYKKGDSSETPPSQPSIDESTVTQDGGNQTMTNKPEKDGDVQGTTEDAGAENAAAGTEVQAYGPAMVALSEAPTTEDTTESMLERAARYAKEDRQAQAEALRDGTNQALIEETVQEINRIAERTVEKGQMEIGELVFEKVFQRDISLASSRNPRKDASFSRICSHERLRVNGNSLNNWTRAAAERGRLDLDLPHLTMSHYIALLGVEDLDQRRALALEADANGYSVRELKKQITPRTKETGSRKVATFLMRKAGNILALLGNQKAVQFLSDQERVSEVFSRPERLKLLADIKESLKALQGYERLISGVHDMLVTIALGTLTTLSDEDEEGSEEDDESDLYAEQDAKTAT